MGFIYKKTLKNSNGTSRSKSTKEKSSNWTNNAKPLNIAGHRAKIKHPNQKNKLKQNPNSQNSPLLSQKTMKSLPLKFLSFSLLFLLSFSLFSIISLKTPFHPSDLLPLLPREASWPILRTLNSAVDLLPTFVGAASSSNSTLEWKGACFYKNEAWLEFHNKSQSQFGGGTLHIKVRV